MCAEAGLKFIISKPVARSQVGIAKKFLTRRTSLAPGRFEATYHLFCLSVAKTVSDKKFYFDLKNKVNLHLIYF